MRTSHFIMFFTFIVTVYSQRPTYAGRAPIGYPTIETTSTTLNPIENRFGEEVTTERLPIEALGDRDLVNRLSKMPVDSQPFWYINWQALEDLRNHQQTYQQKESSFLTDAIRISQGQTQAQAEAQAQNFNEPSNNQSPESNQNSWEQ